LRQTAQRSNIDPDQRNIARIVVSLSRREAARLAPMPARISPNAEKGFFMNAHHYHAVVWIDHREARVFHINAADVELLVVHPDKPAKHIHHKANSIGSGHASVDLDYFHAVAEAVSGAGAILITGPANAKAELMKHIHHHHPKLMDAIAGVETIDHPSDAQLVAHARKYFKAADRMQPQKV
jgi:hypothetical protein